MRFMLTSVKAELRLIQDLSLGDKKKWLDVLNNNPHNSLWDTNDIAISHTNQISK